MAMIEAAGLTKYYGKYMSIESVGFTVEKGEIFGIVGAEDAGKTTVIDILAGAVKPSSGSASVCGLDAVKDAGQLSRMVRVVSQNGESYAKIRARNVDKYLKGILQEGTRQRAQRWCEMFHLDGNDSIRKLSKEKKTALYLIHALIAMPRVLMLDDPFAQASAEWIAQVAQLLKNETARGLTVVITGRDESLLRNVCTSIAMMRDGRMVGVEKIAAQHEAPQQAQPRVQEHPEATLDMPQERGAFEGMGREMREREAFEATGRMPRPHDAFVPRNAPRDAFDYAERVPYDAFAQEDRREREPYRAWEPAQAAPEREPEFAPRGAADPGMQQARARRRSADMFDRLEHDFFEEEPAAGQTPGPREEYPRYGAQYSRGFDGYDARFETREPYVRREENFDAPHYEPRREENFDAPRYEQRREENFDALRYEPRREENFDAPRYEQRREENFDAPRYEPRREENFDAPRYEQRREENFDAPRYEQRREENFDAPRYEQRREENFDAPRYEQRREENFDAPRYEQRREENFDAPRYEQRREENFDAPRYESRREENFDAMRRERPNAERETETAQEEWKKSQYAGYVPYSARRERTAQPESFEYSERAEHGERPERDEHAAFDRQETPPFAPREREPFATKAQPYTAQKADAARPRHARHARVEDYPLYAQEAPGRQGPITVQSERPANRRITLVADDLPVSFLRGLGATGLHRDGDRIEFFFNGQLDTLIIALSQMHVRDLRISMDVPVR